MPMQRHVRAAAHQPGVPSALDTHPSPVRTTVVDYQSPPALVAEKAQQLQRIGPSGWRRLLLYRLISLPVWLAYGAHLLSTYATRLPVLLRQPDPSAFHLEPPFPLQEQFLDVNGVRLHAVSPGRCPDKPLLLMLHGWPECWYSWRHQMAAFAGDFDVVALDMRGFSSSSKPQGVSSYSMSQVAADVKEAVAALGHSSCSILAHDWGGLVAWTVAGLHGRSLVKQLVVMALPHIGVSMTNYTTLEEYAKLTYQLFFQARGLSELYVSADNAAALDGFFRGDTWGVKNKGALSDKDLAWFRAAMCQPGVPTASLGYYRSLIDFTTSSDPQDPVWQAWRRRLDIPTLVLHGDSDNALGVGLLSGIEAAVPNVTVKVLQNCSHWVQQDYPEQVNDIVAAWLQEQRQRQPSRASAAETE